MPSTLQPSERLGLPAVRKKLFIPMPKDWNTNPTQMMVIKLFAGCQSSSLAPNAVSRGSAKSTLQMPTATAMPKSNTAVLPKIFSTLLWLPRPSSIAAMALPPMPPSMEKPMRMVCTGKAICVTAAPMMGTATCKKAVSMML